VKKQPTTPDYKVQTAEGRNLHQNRRFTSKVASTVCALTVLVVIEKSADSRTTQQPNEPAV